MKQPAALRNKASANKVTVREINSQVFAGTGSCYVSGPGFRYRIGLARRRAGKFEGRIISGSERTWEVLPEDATIEFYGHGWNGPLARTLGGKQDA